MNPISGCRKGTGAPGRGRTRVGRGAPRDEKEVTVFTHKVGSTNCARKELKVLTKGRLPE